MRWNPARLDPIRGRVGRGINNCAPRVRVPHAASGLVLLLVAAAFLTGAGSAWAETCAEEYCYDGRGRLLEALLCGTRYSYRYDAAGNLIERTVGPGTAPLVCDADLDGLADTKETNNGTYVSPDDTGTNPFLADTDGDGLVDGVEKNTGIFISPSDTGSDPHNPDTDGDGVNDGAEVAAGTNPNPVLAVPGLGPQGLTLLAALLFASGAVLYRRKHLGHTAAALLLALPSLILSGSSAQAAVCGPSAMTFSPGQTKQYVIHQNAADEGAGPTSYTAGFLPAAGATATVSPGSQTTSQLARFDITAVSLGTNLLVIDWVAAGGPGAPPASGTCAVTVNVVANTLPPTSANNRDSAKSAGVDLFTGERLEGPWSLFELGGPLPLGLRVSYASARVRDGLGFSSLGFNWSHNFEWRLFTVGSETRIATPRGRLLRFTQAGGSFTLQSPLEIPFQLVADGAERVLRDPSSHLRYRFNAAGLLTSIFDRNDNTLTLSYTGQLLNLVDDNLGRVLNFVYDANHFLSSATDGTRTAEFSVVAGLLTQWTDAKSNTTAFTYSGAVADTPGLLSVITYANGDQPYTVTYGPTGKVTSRMAAELASGGTGGTNTFLLDGNPKIVRYENFDPGPDGVAGTADDTGEERRYLHDATGNQLSMIDGNGDTTAWSYGPDGRPTGRVDAEGRSTAMVYNATSGMVAETTRPDGTTQSIEFLERADALGLVDADIVGINRYDGTSIAYTVDTAGNVLSETDPANKTWSFTYNGRGQRLSATSPTAVTSSVSFNLDGTPAAWVNTAGNTTTGTYDALKRLIQLNHPNATSTAWTLDANNARTSVTDARGQVTQITLDALGRIAQVTDPGLEIWQRAYNTMGLVTDVSNPLGQGTSTSYDARELRVAETDASGRTTSYSYDNARHRVGVTDNDGQTSTSTFNAVGALTSNSNSLGETSTFGRNILDQHTGATSPEGRSWSRDPDALNRSRAYIDPRGRRWPIDRDPRGLIQTVTNPDGTQIAFAHNAAGQATAFINENGNAWLRLLDTAGRTQATSDPLGNSITLSHDTRNRVIQRTFPAALGSETRSYNDIDQLTQRAFSDGTSRTFAYDENGWLSGATGVTLSRDSAGRINGSNGLAVEHDAAGRPTKVTFPPGGLEVTFDYDARGLLASINDDTNPTIPAVAFTYAADGSPTNIVRANGTATFKSYDNDRRLTGIQHTSGAPSITLAEVAVTRGADGLVTAATRNAGLAVPSATPDTTTIAWNDASQPIAKTGGPNPGTIEHDALGRRTSDGFGNRNFDWNLDGTLASYTEGSTAVALTSDANGNWTSVGEDTITRNYAFPTGPPAIDGNFYMIHHPTTRALLYKIDRTTLERIYFHEDEMGNIWQLTNDAGVVVASYAYSPLGNQVSAVGAPAVIAANRYNWRGGKWGVRQLEQGLYLGPGHRVLDATTGSVLNKDFDPRSHNTSGGGHSMPAPIPTMRSALPLALEIWGGPTLAEGEKGAVVGLKISFKSTPDITQQPTGPGRPLLHDIQSPYQIFSPPHRGGTLLLTDDDQIVDYRFQERRLPGWPPALSPPPGRSVLLPPDHYDALSPGSDIQIMYFYTSPNEMSCGRTSPPPWCVGSQGRMGSSGGVGSPGSGWGPDNWSLGDYLGLFYDIIRGGAGEDGLGLFLWINGF